MRKSAMILSFIILCGIAYGQNIDEIDILIEKGEFFRAENMIKQELFNNEALSQAKAKDYWDRLTRIDNIRKDYPYTHDEMFKELKSEMPDLTPSDISRWEKDTTLECRIIDGRKKYFRSFSYNLFALNREAAGRRLPKKPSPKKPKKYDPIR